jgi:hypothetical protein
LSFKKSARGHGHAAEERPRKTARRSRFAIGSNLAAGKWIKFHTTIAWRREFVPPAAKYERSNA